MHEDFYWYHPWNMTLNIGRISSTGVNCKGMNSFMDYTPIQDRWSPCAVEEMTKYYNKIGPEVWKNTCMPLLGNVTSYSTVQIKFYLIE